MSKDTQIAALRDALERMRAALRAMPDLHPFAHGESAPRVRMICSHCKGSNVMRDAWARWDEDAQCWSLGDVYDHAHCEDCDGDTRIEEGPAEADPSERLTDALAWALDQIEDDLDYFDRAINEAARRAGERATADQGERAMSPNYNAAAAQAAADKEGAR